MKKLIKINEDFSNVVSILLEDDYEAIDKKVANLIDKTNRYQAYEEFFFEKVAAVVPKGKMAALRTWIDEVLSENPSEDELFELWREAGAYIRFYGITGKIFRFIRNACERHLASV